MAALLQCVGNSFNSRFAYNFHEWIHVDCAKVTEVKIDSDVLL